MDRPKPSVMLVILVSGSLELLLDSWRSRENCARRWLVSRQGRALVSETEALSVVTFSSPLLLIANVVTGLAGRAKHRASKNPCCPVIAKDNFPPGSRADRRRRRPKPHHWLRNRHDEVVQRLSAENHRTSIEKTDCRGQTKDALVVTGKNECFIALDGAAHGETELLLLVAGPGVGAESHGGRARVEDAVTKEVKTGTVPVVRT